MIYRFQMETPREFCYGGVKRRLCGVGEFMGFTLINLPSPRHVNPKARFYFTELGYKMFGPLIQREALETNVFIRVIRKKNPKKSDIVYQDKYQVAILH